MPANHRLRQDPGHAPRPIATEFARLCLATSLTIAATGASAEIRTEGPRDPDAARLAFETTSGPVLPQLPERLDQAPGKAALREAPPARPQSGPFVSVQVNVSPTGANILGDAANEPSIAVDPTDPARMAIGWRQFDTIESNFREAGYSFSRDAGRTWAARRELDPGLFRSDPVLASSADGRFYFSSLRSEVGALACDLFFSTDGGAHWNGPNMAFGGDKQWIVVDRTQGPGRGSVYSAWALAGACCGTNTFTRSTDGGYSFITPVNIPSNPQWGSMEVSPEGTVYVVGIPRGDPSRAFVARSGSAQHPGTLPLFEWTSRINLGGTVRAGLGIGSPNPDGLLGQVWIAADPTGGPRKGWMYVCASVDPPGDDPMDVMFARSTDYGLTWSPPMRLNDVATGWQWFGTMSVAPNGRIDVVWNDTRDSNALNRCALYYTGSHDGGLSWSPNLKLSPVWDSFLGWPMQNKIGDYYHMVSDRTGADLAYAATFNGEQDVWFVRIGDYDCNRNGVPDGTDIVLGYVTDWNENGIPDTCEPLDVSDVDGPLPRFRLYPNVPNPFNPATTIPFDLPAAARARLQVHDIAGRLVRTLERDGVPGRNTFTWDGRDASGRSLSSGVYVVRLEAGARSATRRVTLVR